MGEGREQSVNICACTPSWTVTSRAISASKGVTMYSAESKGRNFSELKITSAKGLSTVEFEPEPSSLFNGAEERFLRSFPGSVAAVFRKSRVVEDTLEVTGEESITEEFGCRSSRG